MVLALIAGILLAIHRPGFISDTICMAGILLASAFAIVCVLVNAFKRRSVLNAGPAALMALFLLGFANVRYSTERRSPDHLIHCDSIDAYTAVVVASPGQSKSSWKQLAEVRRVLAGGAWLPVRGKVVLYYDTTLFPTPFSYGDVIAVKGSPQVVPGPANPHAFDYRKFLQYKNIYHQHFIRSPDLTLLGYDPPSGVMEFAIKTRFWVRDLLFARIRGEEERAIIAALILGITDGMDADLRGAYGAAGAMHVLAVSGLHVGIIYLILTTVLSPLRRLRGGKWILMLTSLAILWGYACVTGLSPSVLRAVTMFSFVVAGQPLGYRTNIYNSLAASAFFLLLLDPFLIMAVGFQLSYIAVLAIVYFHPLLYDLFEPDSRFVDYIWNASAVSIAAQLGTLPLCLFYFHQFPTYFLIANLFVIPLAFCVLTGAILMVVLSGIPYLGYWAGVAEEALIRFLNYLIFQVEKLPFAVVDGITLSFLQCVVIAAIIVAVTLLLQYRRFYFALVISSLLVVFGVDKWTAYLRTYARAHLVVYQVSGSQVVDVIHRGTAWCIGDASRTPAATINYQVSPNRLALSVLKIITDDNPPFARHFPGGLLMRWEDRTIMILRELSDGLNHASVDYLIVSGPAMRRLPEVIEKITADITILDSSNSYFVTDKALKSLTQTVQIHSVWHGGAFEVNW
jgi:ComEC/Rec2-related protein